MQIPVSIQLALGLSLLRTASAGVDNLPPSDSFTICNPANPYLYSRPMIEQATQEGINHSPKVKRIGGFAHEFGNNRKLPFSDRCKGKQLYEYPLIPRFGVYKGGNPGPDRVVFHLFQDPDVPPAPINGVYCGAMTHSGAPPGEFNICGVED